MIVDQAGHDVPILANDWESYKRTKAPVYVGQPLAEAAEKAGLLVDAVKATVKAYIEAIAAGKGKTLTPGNTLPKARTVEKAQF